jgi:hypothetical protein
MNTRIVRIVVMLLWAVASTACDRGCDILVYNPSEQELVLYVGPTDIGARIEPCSVRIFPSERTPWPVGIRVTDPSGAEVYTATLEPKMRPRGLGQVDVRVPAEPSASCPRSLPGRHVVVVRNDTDQQVAVVVDEQDLGTVQARSTMKLGPFEGGVTFIPPTKVLDSEGGLTWWYPEVDYLLTDEFAEYRIVVTSNPWGK